MYFNLNSKFFSGKYIPKVSKYFFLVHIGCFNELNEIIMKVISLIIQFHIGH